MADAVAGSGVAVGGQNCHPAPEGAYTGEVSPQMLLDAGCKYVIIGHSERRHGLAEPDLFLNRKVKAATAAGLKRHLLRRRTAGRAGGEPDRGRARIPAGGRAGRAVERELSKVVIAYEPVWAIGTGKVATPEQAQDVHAFIRKRFAGQFGEAAAQALVIQYGGSVKPDNAAEILKKPDVDGRWSAGPA